MKNAYSDYMRSRTSWRSYSNEVLSESDLSQVKDLIDKPRPGKLGTSITYQIIDREEFQNKKLKLGTYGFIQNARYFLAGSIAPSKTGFLDYGYLLEKIILELTGLGLGTCWLGGTFDRGGFSKAIILKEGFVIPAITPFGYGTNKRRVGDRLIRLGANSRNRKLFSALFYNHRDLTPLLPDQQNSLTQILDLVRIAPSASNLQPWRITVEDQLVHFFLARKQSYKKAFGQVDIQMIDMGIAMCHFDLAASEHGLSIMWEQKELSASNKGWEYVISAHIK